MSDPQKSVRNPQMSVRKSRSVNVYPQSANVRPQRSVRKSRSASVVQSFQESINIKLSLTVLNKHRAIFILSEQLKFIY